MNFRNILIGAVVFLSSFSFAFANENIVNVYLFAREDCNFCHQEEVFLDELSAERTDFEVIYLDVNDSETKVKFGQLTELYNLSKATPITLVGNSIIQGFSSEETTGKLIRSAIDEQKGKKSVDLDYYLTENRNILPGGEETAMCGEKEATSCSITVRPETKLKVLFFGVIDYKDFSLFSMTVILGFVDGFNPCAMWVLLTFLLVLWQIGNRKKMFQVAGLFIFAEAVMYWLILNFWFSTWNFVGLDQIVTPAVGGLAILGGIYFLRRYFKNKNQLVCDVTSEGYKNKTEEKIKDLIKSPMTILTAIGIIALAFSINMIEFACSIGIPQTFTKVLEMNNLGTVTEQFYILLYTFFYMIDDFVLFGLALYGFEKFYTIGKDYSNLSSLIGGVLMIILGALLIFAPSLLVF